MKVLLVSVFKKDLAAHAAPFVVEQQHALQRCGVECELFLINSKGIRGYLSQLKPLKEKAVVFQPDVIHAHYGLCGLLANLQRKVPVVTTYHGSDINDPRIRFFSQRAIRLSKWNIFVSRKAMDLVRVGKHGFLLPCGIDLTALQLTSKHEARKRLQWDEAKRYVLFAGAFDNPVKDAPLARKVVGLVDVPPVELLELKGYSREEVTLMMCGADALLMTSVSEGSPQVVKEAMACGCPVVSVDVGDVKERVESVGGCYVAQTRDPQELAGLLGQAMAFVDKTRGREKIVADGLDNLQVAQKLVKIYSKVK